jgi:hypothetical protein
MLVVRLAIGDVQRIRLLSGLLLVTWRICLLSGLLLVTGEEYACCPACYWAQITTSRIPWPPGVEDVLRGMVMAAGGDKDKVAKQVTTLLYISVSILSTVCCHGRWHWYKSGSPYKLITQC